MTNQNHYETILFDIRDHVAHITLNRPDAANAANGQMGKDLLWAILQCDNNPAVRAVLLTGSGRFFCAGGDLKEFYEQEALDAHIKEMLIYLHGGLSRMAQMNAPVIAAVNGTAAGAGMSLACACDLVYVAESARFTMGYTASGLSPDGSSTYYLPRLVGHKRALELMLTNRMLSAQEALDWGIATAIFPDDTLLDKVTAIANKLATGPTAAFGETKRLLRLSANESLETQMEHEGRAIAARSMSQDGQEGISAFVEKRKPQFTGWT
jgi:2-(1,2-epoxy-1,2-dihydrophenyl)acetyl-CoA isomerase